MNFRGMLAAVVALATHPACLAGPNRLAPPPPAPAQHAAASAPAVVAPSDVPAAPSAAPPEAATAPPAPRCTAMVRAEVHLRPTPTPRTVGAPWPAGTTFEVLAVDPWMRREIPGDEDAGVLAEVRVVASGERGWTFVRYTELAPECPVFIEPPQRDSRQPVAPEAGEECARGSTEAPSFGYALRGPRRFRSQLFPCCEGAPELLRLGRGDFDGDGVEDELVHAPRSCLCWSGEGSVSNEAGAAVALMRRPGGWLGADVVMEATPDHGPNASYEGMVRAGRAVYLRWSYDENLGDNARAALPARAYFATVRWMLVRIDRCGVAHQVATVFPPLAGGCTWAGTADGSVEFVCRRPARRAVLRWDEARFELVPDRAPMPLSGGWR